MFVTWIYREIWQCKGVHGCFYEVLVQVHQGIVSEVKCKL